MLTVPNDFDTYSVRNMHMGHLAIKLAVARLQCASLAIALAPFFLQEMAMMPQLTTSGHLLPIPQYSFSLVRFHQDSGSFLFPMKRRGFTSQRTGTKSTVQEAQTFPFPELKDGESRRSSDYHPTIWDHKLIESINSPYDGGEFDTRIEQLKSEIRQLLTGTDEPLAKLELIDSIRRLGLAYHFEEEIAAALTRFLYTDSFEGLHGLKETALCFRFLREHGHFVSSDVFRKFREGDEFTFSFSQDVEGLLSLYEATHLALPGEQILEDAKEFSVKHLRCPREDVDSNLAEKVRRSLEVPLYWLMPRVVARHYIDIYEKEEVKSSTLLELAKLDFNVVQALHQRDIKDLSRWWEKLGLVQTVNFSRDRIFENCLWGNGIAFEPQFSECRKLCAKLISVVNVIDDFYDVYSTLEEAKQFTVAIRRWDLRATEGLPYNMKLCYLALYNFVNETAYDIFRDSGLDVRCYLERECICLCESYLKEAEWFHKKITPPLAEYMENGWTSVGNRILTYHAFYYAGHNLTEKSLDHFDHAYELIRRSSLLVRLIDDLAPSKAEIENGETSLSIQCRMKDSGESYEASKEFIKDLIGSYWKELNKETLNTDLPRIFVYMAINTSRACYTMFEQGDGLGDGTGIVKDYINSLFIEPIRME